ncbi:hypothetical protein [Jiangella sp. DSM 45060]|uniref:hypothetical protein n=1 Tax=Jiangella sp. DSM 45060 TaxID=1798224 RepID=UPI00087DA10D|nr:hypothetical protein [Jiangella sp. DSM 45060]SDT30796.1 hypothetical protein SAMN04515669_3488 [Jiangella sp. DSM 45060]
MSSRGGTTLDAATRVPRDQLLAQAWAGLGDGVTPLSNASGRPLVRTVRLILDPLVLRPAQNPRFAGATVAAADAADLTRLVAAAGPVLTATAAWFVLVKRERRRAGVTDGNPQERYFQRCYELAHRHGHPDDVAGAAELAAATVAAARTADGRVTAAAVRAYVTDPAHAAELARRLDAAWTAREAPAAPSEPAPQLDEVLATCATAPDPRAWAALVDGGHGSCDAAHLEPPGAARHHGLTDRASVTPPGLGDAASKRGLPKPFDRSVLERLFAGVATGHPIDGDVAALVGAEIGRSARPWQLAGEPGRVLLALGRAAAAALDDDTGRAPDDARSRLRSRWRREAYVHRVLRLPPAEAAAVPDELRAEVRDVRAAYLRRLWVRLHGRELRGQDVDAGQCWDLLDGVLRSVILDQRDRLRTALSRDAEARP